MFSFAKSAKTGVFQSYWKSDLYFTITKPSNSIGLQNSKVSAKERKAEEFRNFLMCLQWALNIAYFKTICITFSQLTISQSYIQWYSSSSVLFFETCNNIFIANWQLLLLSQYLPKFTKTLQESPLLKDIIKYQGYIL